MNLTDIEKERLLHSYFDEHLLPIAEKMRKRGIEFFPMFPNESVETYYKKRNDDGNYVHEINFQETSSELKSILDSKELPELSELAESLVSLSETLHEQEETKDEVSPFVYAMF